MKNIVAEIISYNLSTDTCQKIFIEIGSCKTNQLAIFFNRIQDSNKITVHQKIIFQSH